jgi:hypothetical protein
MSATANVTVTAPTVADLRAAAEMIGDSMSGGLAFSADPAGKVTPQLQRDGLTQPRQVVCSVEQEWVFRFETRPPENMPWPGTCLQAVEAVSVQQVDANGVERILTLPPESIVRVRSWHVGIENCQRYVVLSLPDDREWFGYVAWPCPWLMPYTGEDGEE